MFLVIGVRKPPAGEVFRGPGTDRLGSKRESFWSNPSSRTPNQAVFPHPFGAGLMGSALTIKDRLAVGAPQRGSGVIKCDLVALPSPQHCLLGVPLVKLLLKGQVPSLEHPLQTAAKIIQAEWLGHVIVCA